ncbi:MAG: clostripain-related cysteine peptidase [bacterium]
MRIKISKCVCNSYVLLIICICVCLFQVSTVSAVAEWTILNYIEADNNIERFGLSNISVMQKVGSTDNVNILAQVDDAHFIKTWRYKIVKNGIAENVSLNQEMGLNPEQELTSSMTQWVLPNYPAKRLMLILWNHGNGILDEPSDKVKLFKRKKERLSKTQNIVQKDIKDSGFKRGILYDYHNDTFLNNQELDRALSVIVAQNNGKKIDVIGMDACLMAMLEVAYQIKDYACYFVGSENVERVPGWNYADFLSTLVAKPTMGAQALVREIVASFAQLNRNVNFFTQSAINLDKIELVKNDVDLVLQALDACKTLAPSEIQNVVVSARRDTPAFYKGNYIDLGCFYKNLLRALSSVTTLNARDGQKNRGHVADTPYNRARSNLQIILKEAIKNIRAAVLVCMNGSVFKAAQGLSIYFPKSSIHPSYALTKFAQETQWLNFITNYKAAQDKDLDKKNVREKFQG